MRIQYFYQNIILFKIEILHWEETIVTKNIVIIISHIMIYLLYFVIIKIWKKSINKDTRPCYNNIRPSDIGNIIINNINENTATKQKKL